MNGYNTILLLASMVPGEGTVNDLHSRIERGAGVSMNFSGVYVQLDRLERAGLAKSRPVSRLGRRRCLWSITREGRARLDRIKKLEEFVLHHA